MKPSIFFLTSLIVCLSVSAQDTDRKKEVNITSTFKPTLKEAAKISFNATPPITDTTRPQLKYNVPNQNLSFMFQPGTLRPLALQVDTGGRWNNESYVKVGYGNLSTPFVQAGISFGDGRDMGLTIYAKHISSKGKIDFQDYSNSQVDLNAFIKASGNMQWNVRFGGYQQSYNRYGYEPKSLVFPDDSMEIKYQTWRGRVNVHNINVSSLGISYSPEIKLEMFHDQLNNTENNTFVNVPLRKMIGQNFGVDLALTANLSRYKQDNKSALSNNYFSFSPSILFRNANVNIQAGIRPSWNNSEFRLLPNVVTEFSSNDNRFAFQFGWTGRLRNSGFQYLAGMNPWIMAPDTVYNTTIEERFVGFRGTLGDHFSFSGKLASNLHDNQPLYVNDTASGNTFNVLRESEMKVISLGGELGYTVGEKFSVISNLTLNQYHGLKDHAKAWGLLPLEWKTTMRLQLLKDLYVNSTLYAFDGPWALSKDGRRNMQAAMDLSAGFEFKVIDNIKLWAQFNNVFNKSYQRWNQYPVYGFNFLGGVVFSFAQNN